MTGPTTRVGSTFGHYQLRALLGRGGMGEVYEAYDTAKDRTVALKILSDQHCGDETFRERFRRESHAAAKLEEPHVIPIHDWGEVDGTLYIDMRRVDGVDLRTLLKRGGPLDPPRAVAITGQVAAALDAAHAAGLIHRDVKPENVLVTGDDFAYLVDFGIAEAAGESRLTIAGTAVGSFAYMAPERFGTGTVTAASDTYSLACVLFEMLVGSAPFPPTSLQQVITAHTSLPPPRPSALRPAVPATFDDVIARGMAKEPHNRFGSTGALARAARQALSAGPAYPDPAATRIAGPLPPTVVAPTPAPYRPPPPRALPQQIPPVPQRPSWMIPALITAVIAVVVLAAGFIVLLVVRADDANRHESTPPPTREVTAGVPTSRPNRSATSQTPPPAAQPTLPPTARPCPATSGPAGSYTQSAAGTPVTSCEFAEAVRVAYGNSGPPSSTPRVVQAFSPVTNKWYPMTCTADAAMATCTGGEDAVVYAY